MQFKSKKPISNKQELFFKIRKNITDGIFIDVSTFKNY